VQEGAAPFDGPAARSVSALFFIVGFGVEGEFQAVEIGSPRPVDYFFNEDGVAA
jgi:hypothetical protein